MILQLIERGFEFLNGFWRQRITTPNIESETGDARIQMIQVNIRHGASGSWFSWPLVQKIGVPASVYR